VCVCAYSVFVQARIDAEKLRLATTRVSETSDLAVAAAAVSGQQLLRSITLQELLRRPHIHHRCAASGAPMLPILMLLAPATITAHMWS
jgi:hypothetical protein